ncbi:MAG TPA: alpha/beta hydrolase [Candidatus Limnocylindrales bacterium]|jgi:pimeloyl-ACP methyl ester carboxylesterase
MSFSPDQTGKIEVPGATIFYESTGRGLGLVLVHAGICDQSMWDDNVPSFAGGHQVITYDCRGFGATRSTDVAFSNRADLIAVLDEVGLDRAALLGCSRAGSIVLDTTLEYPDRVSALIWVNGGLGGFEHEPTPAELALFEAAEAFEEARDWTSLADMDVRIWVDGVGQAPTRVPTQIRERVRAMSLANYVTEHPYGQPIVLDPPAAGRLAEVAVPTLIIEGDLDPSDTHAAADALAAGIAGARRVVMKGVAHLPNLERPDDFSRHVRDFLAAAKV